MTDWIAARAKMFVALIMPGIVTGLITGIEGVSGFDIPTTWELALISVLVGAGVYQVPNKQIK